MHIESESSPSIDCSPSLFPRKFRTPSTHSPLCEDPATSGLFSPSVSEFSLEAEMAQVTKMMGNVNLEEKENIKHTTDRFIPLRKHSLSENYNAFSCL